MQDSTLDVDFKQAKTLGDTLLTQLDALREENPVAWSPMQKAWIITGHEEVIEAFRGDLPFSANRVPRIASFMPDPEERARRIPYVMATFSRMLLNLDPPEQPRVRQLLMKAFNRHMVEFYRPYTREVIADALTEAANKPQIDFVDVVARRIPSRVIVRLMGLSDEYIPRLRHWAWATLSGAGGGGTTPNILDETEKVFHEMREAFIGEIEKRRNVRGEDFISSLLAAEVGGEHLTDEEIVATCIMSLIAGHDTTGNTIGLGSLALARDPAIWQQFREIPFSDRLDAVMELQRVIAMSTAQGRVVAKNFSWQGHEFKEGQLVYIMIAAANRDPNVFENPERIDFHRPQQDNVVFGPGLHHCIGHLLAKMQLLEFFPALVERFDGIEVLDKELDWGTMIGFRGLQSLKARMIPREVRAD